MSTRSLPGPVLSSSDVDTFNVALDAFVAYMQRVSDEHLTANGYEWKEPVSIDNRLAPVYIRILKSTGYSGQRSVVGFVRRSDGAILYPAGWKGPYLKGKSVVRGSIYDTATWPVCINYHGVKTVR